MSTSVKTIIRFCLWRFIAGFVVEMMKFGMGFLEKSRKDWNPRMWSNSELSRFGSVFKGDIINVGAWRDGDKEGGFYKDYFTNANSYTIANYGGEDGRSDVVNEKVLDLSIPYDGRFGTFDTVLTHTVIEHIFESDTVIDNLCLLSRDSIITIVPFLQGLHGRDGTFDDFWRYTPFSLSQLFEERGFSTLYCSWNEGFPLMNVYLFHVAVKDPKSYAGIFPDQPRPIVGVHGPGVLFSQFLFGEGEQLTWGRRFGNILGSILHVKPEK